MKHTIYTSPNLKQFSSIIINLHDFYFFLFCYSFFVAKKNVQQYNDLNGIAYQLERSWLNLVLKTIMNTDYGIHLSKLRTKLLFKCKTNNLNYFYKQKKNQTLIAINIIYMYKEIFKSVKRNQ